MGLFIFNSSTHTHSCFRNCQVKIPSRKSLPTTAWVYCTFFWLWSYQVGLGFCFQNDLALFLSSTWYSVWLCHSPQYIQIDSSQVPLDSNEIMHVMYLVHHLAKRRTLHCDLDLSLWPGLAFSKITPYPGNVKRAAIWFGMSPHLWVSTH